MHPIHLLAKTMAKSLSVSSGGGKGIPVFDSNDAAYALAKLNPILSHFAYWRWCGDDARYKSVKGNVLTKALRFARENNFKIKTTTLAGLADAALFQLSQPACGVCDGVPYKRVNEELVACLKCKATGKRQLSIRQISQAANITHKSFSDNHLAVMDHLCEYLNDCEDKIIRHVRDRIA